MRSKLHGSFGRMWGERLRTSARRIATVEACLGDILAGFRAPECHCAACVAMAWQRRVCWLEEGALGCAAEGLIIAHASCCLEIVGSGSGKGKKRKPSPFISFFKK
eukprot:3937339-Rhodomonas_salina.4